MCAHACPCCSVQSCCKRLTMPPSTSRDIETAMYHTGTSRAISHPSLLYPQRTGDAHLEGYSRLAARPCRRLARILKTPLRIAMPCL
eukprot:IDg14124t1